MPWVNSVFTTTPPRQGNASLQHRPLQKSTTNQNAELGHPVPMDTPTKHALCGRVWIEEREGRELNYNLKNKQTEKELAK